MNHTQRGVLGTTVIALFVVALFYIPWRIESTGNVMWAPFYRNPAVGTSTLKGKTIESRFVRLKGQPIWWLHGLQLVSVAGAGYATFHLVRREEEPEEVEV